MAEMKKFSIKQALRYGFSQFFEHAGLIFSAMFLGLAITVGTFLAAGTIVALILYFMTGSQKIDLAFNMSSESMSREAVSAYVDSLFSSLALPAGIVVIVALILCSFFLYSLYLGFIRILFDIYEFNSSSVSRLFSCRPITLQAWVVEVLYKFMMMIGFLLLFVPGLFVVALYGFAKFALVDRGGGVFESFSYSAKLAQGAKMELLAFYVTIALIMAASAIFPPFWLILYPSLLLSTVFVYKKLQEQTI